MPTEADTCRQFVVPKLQAAGWDTDVHPVYPYSLRQGIADGFLATYRAHRIVTRWDATDCRPSMDELDRYGRTIPDEEYHTADLVRIVSPRARTLAIARHLTDFLRKTDCFAKAIVFCVDQEHASEMRADLKNLNAALVRDHPNYVCRVTADEGDIGMFFLNSTMSQLNTVHQF
jgi:type I restriction enzyme R subunit